MCSFSKKGFCPLISKWLFELVAGHRQARRRCQSLVRRLDLGFEMGLDVTHDIRFLLQYSFLMRAGLNCAFGCSCVVNRSARCERGSIGVPVIIGFESPANARDGMRPEFRRLDRRDRP